MRRTLEDRPVRNFLHQSTLVRWLVFVVSFAAITMLSIFGGRRDLADLTVGQISPRKMVARVNFSYPDQSATLQEQERVSRQSPNVYRLLLEPFQRDILRLRHLFERVRQLKQSRISETKLKQIADIWNEAADIPLAGADVQTLLSVSDRKGFIENIERSGARLAEAGILGDDQFSNPETTIRWSANPEDFSKLRVARVRQFLTATQARQRLLDEISPSMPPSKATLKAMERIVADLLAPNLHLNVDLSARLQEQDRHSVNPIRRDISKGNVLIEWGERVTDEKLIMLKKHEAEAEREFATQSRWRQWGGSVLLVCMILAVMIQILAFHPRSEQPTSNREYTLLATILVLHLGLCRLISYLVDAWGMLSPSLTAALLPLCFGTMLASILLGQRRAWGVALGSSLLMGMVNQFSFVLLLTSVVSSLVGIHFVHPLRRRVRIYGAGLLAGAAAAAVMFVFGFMAEVPWNVLGWQATIAVGAGFAVSLLINSLLPLLESTFKVTTDLRWLELSDLNHPLLRRMVMEAPGTYHHSLVVANLAERACEAIGAHALQARVCSYFHDIGKLNNPRYFCENQVESENPHDDVAPNMSALIIIAHVKDGVDMAIKHRLARPIIDSIQQHHGTSQVSYFYRLARRNEEDARLGSKIMRMNVSDVPRVEEETYRYPGPKPGSREISVISLADAVEGASRSLRKPTPQKIESLVKDLFQERCDDGQWDECPLSLEEWKRVMESFSNTLSSMMHSRIAYPKDEPDVDQPAPVPSATAQ